MTYPAVYRVSYDSKVWFLVIILTISLGLTTFYLKENFFTKNLIFLAENKKIYYLYEPPYLERSFNALGMDFNSYHETVEKFIKMNKLMSLKVKIIKNLDNLDKAGALILLEAIALSKEDKNRIKSYIYNGGKILFNSSAAFRDESLNLLGDKFINSITGLKLSQKYGYVKFDSLSASPKLLSALTTYLNREGKLLNLVLYDPLPIFTMPKKRSADLYLTNWSQVSFADFKGKMMPKESSGLVWSGSYGQGKWVYFSFPLYTFYESDDSKPLFNALYRGIVNYFETEVILTPYPYLDAKSVSFVSEDTEYRFESLKQFSDASLKYKIPVTALCVGELAEKNLALMAYVKENPYLNFGSHSYLHKKIVGSADKVYIRETQGSKKVIEKIVGRQIYGFRAPREEIDDKMFHLLEEGNYAYILNKSENQLYPYFKNKMMVIPRHGTDDYSYLVNLDWTPQEITLNMIKESKVLQELNGIYSLSTHTHLMNFSTNISILEGYFEYLQNVSGIVSMTGKMLYDRIISLKKIRLSSTLSKKNILITIANANNEEIKNFTFRVFVPAKNILSLSSEIIGLKTELTQINQGIYDIKIINLKPNSKILIFANYEPIDVQETIK